MIKQAAAAEPRWRRVVDFPVVAMVIAIMLFLVAVAVGTAINSAIKLGQPASSLVHGAIYIALVLAAYKLVIVRLGRQPRDDLQPKDARWNLGFGLLAGALIYSAIVGVAAAMGVYRVVGSGPDHDMLHQLVSDGVMPGFMEEMLFRGILFRWLEAFAGSWIALILSALAFGFAHYFNPGSSVIACVWIAVEAGILLAGCYMLTRSLWMSMGLHCSWNFMQGAIFGVPVSGEAVHGILKAKLVGPVLLTGGAFGLEASVIALVVATAAGLWITYAAVRRGHVVPPSWARGQAISDRTGSTPEIA